MKLLKIVISLLLILLLLTGCFTKFSDELVAHPEADVLLKEYLAAFQARDLRSFREKIVSPNYAHSRRDGSVEDREAYLENLAQIFQLNVRDVQVLETEVTALPTVLKIDMHWMITLGYSFFKEITIVDKTTFTYMHDGQYWKLVEDAPILKDGQVLHPGITLSSYDKMKFYDSISIEEKRVYLRFLLRVPEEFVNLTHKIVIKWYAPDGTLFLDNFDLKTPTAKDYFYWSPMDVQGEVSSAQLGQWRVEIYLNDLFKDEHTFIMTE